MQTVGTRRPWSAPLHLHLNLGYWVNDRGSIPGRGWDLSHCIQTGTGAHPTSYPKGNGDSPGVKRPERDYSHLVPRLRMRGAVPPLPHTSSWRGV